MELGLGVPQGGASVRTFWGGSACEERLKRLIPQMKAVEGVTEDLKMTDQMEWVRRMNSIHHRIEEMLFNELIYD